MALDNGPAKTGDEDKLIVHRRAWWLREEVWRINEEVMRDICIDEELKMYWNK